ncbi:MAG TPA: inorganic diphosphatase [Patescibacteria group bacterium]|nr:inorganic diphosphatase [Patescibacteria group bacterium]
MKMSKTLKLAEKFLNKKVNVVIDRPLGSKHPKHNFTYKSNYGFISNTKSPDGEELDAYFLGVSKPLKKGSGKCVAIIHRLNDDDDKLIVVPDRKELTDKEIAKAIHFQEQWFKYEILRKKVKNMLK